MAGQMGGWIVGWLAGAPFGLDPHLHGDTPKSTSEMVICKTSSLYRLGKDPHLWPCNFPNDTGHDTCNTPVATVRLDLAKQGLAWHVAHGTSAFSAQV